MKKRIRNGMLLLLVLLILGILGYLLVTLGIPRYQEEQAFAAQSDLYEKIRPSKQIALAETQTEPTESTEGTATAQDYLVECHEVTAEILAWITIPDTAIDFPIVQGEDNSYYLSHNEYGESYSYGVPFLDCRNEPDFSGFQSIIYGHNIRGDRMFAGLLHFQDQDYFDSHPTGVLVTSQKQYTISWIACLIVPKEGFVYDVIFLTQGEKETFAEQLQQQAVQYRDTGVDLTEKNLITLSTCSYEFEDARTVLVGYLEEIN